MSDDIIRRASRSTELPERTEESRKLAEQAMAPYLADLQRAADDETRANFAPANETAACVITIANGDKIKFSISGMRAGEQGEVVITVSGDVVVERAR